MILSHACLPIPAHPRWIFGLHVPYREYQIDSTPPARVLAFPGAGRRGGIGRRTGLKIPGPRPCGFESHRRHHVVRSWGVSTDFQEENCENCRFLTGDDRCGNPQSVYVGREVVYRDGDEVLQTAWCEYWQERASLH